MSYQILTRLLLLSTVLALIALASTQWSNVQKRWQNWQSEQILVNQLQAQDRLLKTSQQDGEAWYNRGVLRARLNDLKGAESDFRKALTLEPQDTESLYNLSWVQIREGKKTEALNTLGLLLKIDPQHIDGRWNRGWLYQELKKKSLARADYLLLQKQSPQLSLQDQARLAVLLGKPKQAQTAYNQILKQNPTNTQALLGRARSLLASDQAQAALQDLEQVLKKQPEAGAFQLKAKALLKLQQPTQALQAYTQAIQKSPSAELLKARGELYLQQKMQAEALNDYLKALNYAPRNAQILLTLARLEAEAGKATQALEHLEQAIQLQPQLRQEALNRREFMRLRSRPAFKNLFKTVS